MRRASREAAHDAGFGWPAFTPAPRRTHPLGLAACDAEGRGKAVRGTPRRYAPPRASKKVERVWKELHMQWQLAAPAASRASPRQPQVPLQRQGSQPRAVYCMNGVLLGAFILNAVVTYTYGVHGSFGETAASQLEAFPTLVTPAAWSFSIWAVIFVGEGAFALVQLCTRRFNFADKEEVRTIAPWFLSVCVCQALWTVAIAQPLSSEGQSTWYVWLSLGLMLALWASLYGPPAPHRTDRPADPMPADPIASLPRRPLLSLATLPVLSRTSGSYAWQRSCGCRPASTPTRRDRAGVVGRCSTSPSSCTQPGRRPRSSSTLTSCWSRTRHARRAATSPSSLPSCRWCAAPPTPASP